jgi:hypothetical protein
MSKQSESLGGLMMSNHQTSPEGLNPFEMEAISKFDNIITILRELEEQFLQSRQEVLRKSTLEGKESGKICAIRGRVIASKKKYFRSIESDIQSLDKILQDQLDKIFKEFNCLKTISGFEEMPDEKAPKDLARKAPIPIENQDPYIQDMINCCPYMKSETFLRRKTVEYNKKTIPTCLMRSAARPLSKSGVQVELSKKYDSGGGEIIPNPYAFPQRKETREVKEDLKYVEANLQTENSLLVSEETNGEERNCIVSHVRLELLNQVKSSGMIQTPKKIRSIRSQGYKFSQTQVNSLTRELGMELTVPANDKFTA